MTVEANPAVFRVLIVEDDEPTLRLLVRLLRSVGVSEVDSAENAADALEEIANREREGMAYHLALLDFLVPPQKGASPEGDVKVYRTLNAKKVPIIHYSAFLDDRQIMARMRTVHSTGRMVGGPVMQVQKTATDEWVRKLLGEIIARRGEVVSRQVGHRLDELFGAESSEEERGNGRPDADSAIRTECVCGTPAMVLLHEDIVRNWPYLAACVKERIRRIFAVVELESDTKRLSLFPTEG